MTLFDQIVVNFDQIVVIFDQIVVIFDQIVVIYQLMCKQIFPIKNKKHI
jgi:hypothetical protein